ncbi:hypothetical protein HLRTI_000828 [Halorhabdus tiamatea SARL4B]|uniref:Conserved hypothetical membrane protein n=1 Tax=Halorhabdus tiamatea SARL4B TaxID=1033806 RepID=F7PL91_9EURY|nr:hypothetical protein [Halorhabdus tiamatea]ERJ06975.1 hypothetical protein HLRTI_000828 [Halorhabdus tiamatea SARL4B]CCQ34748.1 conserved hypothetical membrane protein [Halorhabdus tiamatea SARL4B]
MSAPEDGTCPRCETPLGGADECPSCGLTIRTAEDGLTSAAADAIVGRTLSNASARRRPSGRRLPYPFRLATALAISVPFAPLSSFALTSLIPAHPIIVILVGVLSWMAPAAALARTTVPSLIVGRGLLVLGAVVAVTPLVVAAGRAVIGSAAAVDPPIESSQTVYGSFLAFGVLILLAGVAVSRVAGRKRDTWQDASPRHRE